ncbi:MAG TPA: AhpC/TSA family protein [Candidatus Butyricimonas faecavium]|nr:AhpC/TSA family protein [Candidatus Butyricimonas faecavium]
MGRIILYLFLLLLVCTETSAQTGSKDDGYKITGRIVGLPDSDLFLVTDNEVKIDTLANTKSVNGNFFFSGQVNEVIMVHVITAKQEILASMMLENAEFTIMGPNLVGGGGPSQELLARFNQLDVEMVQERERLQQFYIEAEKRKDREKMAEVDAKFQRFLVDVQAKELDLLKRNADTYVAAYIVSSTMRDIDLEKLTMRYNILGESAKETYYGKAIAAQIERYEHVEIGSVAPDFSLDNTTLHEVKGDLKIINFWAAWNAPCRAENVNLLRIYEQYHLKGVEIISVSLDENQQLWRKAIMEDGITEWRHITNFDGKYTEMIQSYCLQSIPYTYILDEDNVIVDKGLSGDILRKKIRELLKKK